MRTRTKSSANLSRLESVLKENDLAVEISDLVSAGKIDLENCELLGDEDGAEGAHSCANRTAESDSASMMRGGSDSAVFCSARFDELSAALSSSLTGTVKTLQKEYGLDDFRACVSYDGGTELSLFGSYKETALILEKLETLKQKAREGSFKAVSFTYRSFKMCLLPQGVRSGFGFYSYVVLVLDDLDRVKYRFYFHRKPCAEIAGIRVKIEYPAFRLTRKLEDVVSEIRSLVAGPFEFNVARELVSRLDLNITSTIPMRFFSQALEDDRIINPCRSSKVFTVGRPVTSIRLGTVRGFQVEIYDKVAELSAKCDDLKIDDLVNVFGTSDREWSRVEFRAHREILNTLSIQSVDDWLNKEVELINYLTFRWFRIGVEGRSVDRRHTLQNKIDPRWYVLRYSLLYAVASRCFCVDFAGSAHYKHYRTLLETEKTIDVHVPRVRRRIPRRFRALPRRSMRQGVGCLVSSIVQMSRGRVLDEAELLSVLESQCRLNLERAYESYRRKSRQYAEQYELMQMGVLL